MQPHMKAQLLTAALRIVCLWRRPEVGVIGIATEAASIAAACFGTR
jgi:hypothetical protein